MEHSKTMVFYQRTDNGGPWEHVTRARWDPEAGAALASWQTCLGHNKPLWAPASSSIYRAKQFWPLYLLARI